MAPLPGKAGSGGNALKWNMWTQGKNTKKCKRYNFANHAHELTFSCYRNQSLLSSKRACEWLVEVIKDARVKYDFSVWAYVLMPTHVHLLIKPNSKDYSISRILSAIKRPVAVKAISYLKQNSSPTLNSLTVPGKQNRYRFWQKGGGYDRNITSVDTLIQTVKYIHANPVRKRLVERPQDWYYSSVREWLGIGKGSLDIDKQNWPVFY